MIFQLETHNIHKIQEKDAWRLCDFIVANEDRLQRFFPKTLAQNLNPNLATIFVKKKVAQWLAKEEFLFLLKERENHTIIGMIYVKELDWKNRQAELAYCIGYQYENKGFTSKSVAIISNWALDELELKTLQIIVHKTNLASVSVAEKCGYKWQKVLAKAHTPPHENSLDMELYELKA